MPLLVLFWSSLSTAQLIMYTIPLPLRVINHGYVEDASYCGDQRSIYIQATERRIINWNVIWRRY
jgi:hypothetical protein